MKLRTCNFLDFFKKDLPDNVVVGYCMRVHMRREGKTTL